MCTAPASPCSSSAAMAMPKRFTQRHMRGSRWGSRGRRRAGSRCAPGRAPSGGGCRYLRLPCHRSLRHGARLGHVVHVAVAVVVVADVLLVQERRGRDLEGRAQVRLYQFATMVWPSGFMLNHSTRMTLSRIALTFGSSAGDQVVGELDGVLRGGHLGGVQPAVDVHDGLALRRQRARLCVVMPRDTRGGGRCPGSARRSSGYPPTR